MDFYVMVESSFVVGDVGELVFDPLDGWVASHFRHGLVGKVEAEAARSLCDEVFIPAVRRANLTLVSPGVASMVSRMVLRNSMRPSSSAKYHVDSLTRVGM